MKKVLFVVDERKLGGVSILLENILNNLDYTNLKIDLLVLSNSGDRFSNLNQDNIKIIYGNKAFDVIDKTFKELWYAKRYMKAFKKLLLSIKIKLGLIKSYILKQRKVLGINNYDVEVAFKAGFCSLFVAYGNSHKKINWVHEDYASYNMTKKYTKTFKKAYSAFDRHVIVSKDAEKSFNEIFHLDDKTCVIDNYIDEKEILNKANINCDYDIDKSKLNIVTVGRFSYEKGQDRLIYAVHLLKDKVDLSNVKIHIVGYGSFKQELDAKIIKYNLEHVIDIIDSKDLKGNVYSFMKQNDMFVLPSRSESFGMARIEALILGLPVLTTNIAATEYLMSKDYSIVVENTTNGIYEGLKLIIQDKELLNQMRENVKSFSYEQKNQKILEEILNLLEE